MSRLIERPRGRQEVSPLRTPPVSSSDAQLWIDIQFLAFGRGPPSGSADRLGDRRAIMADASPAFWGNESRTLALRNRALRQRGER